MSDDQRLPDPTMAVRSLPKGSGIILRHRDSDRRCQLAAALRTVCSTHSVALIVAGDTRLALKVGADGVHLAESDIVRSARDRLWARRRGMMITAAVHNTAALKRAEKAGVHAVLLSPAFPTTSYKTDNSLGVLKFSGMALKSKIPVYALGGVNAENIGQLRHAGIIGMAGIDGVTTPSEY